MGTQRFATGETTRLSISDGDFIDVKKRLSHGEREEMFARMAPTAGPSGIFSAQRREVRTSKVLAYLVAWSLRAGDKPVPYSAMLPEDDRLSTILNLDPDTFDELWNAIDAHEDAIDAAVAAQKKTSSIAPTGEQISPSPSALVGVTSGSDN